jgi:hypothetical protein
MPRIEKPCSVCSAPVRRFPSQFLKQVACSRLCREALRRARDWTGEKNPDWKGGRYVEPGKGYVLVRNPSHPRARQNGYVLEHILVAEQILGRALLPGEVVHHLNHDPADNRPENLKVYATNAEHRIAEKHHPQKGRPKLPPCTCAILETCAKHDHLRSGRTDQTC